MDLACDLAMGEPDGEWFDVVLHHVAGTGGKRVRPRFFLALLDLFGAPLDERAIRVGSLVELLHQVSLLHDDVVDDAPRRRSKESVNQGWGPKTAILLGDFIMARILERLAEFASTEIMCDYAKSSCALARGMLLEHEARFDISVTDSLLARIAREKTGSLFRLSAVLAGRLAEVSDEKRELLSKAGEALGESFQLVDDCLDWTDGKEMGKPTGHDLLEGFVTRPVLSLARIESLPGPLPSRHDPFAFRCWAEESLPLIQERLIETGALAKANSHATRLLEGAFDNLQAALPGGGKGVVEGWMGAFLSRVK